MRASPESLRRMRLNDMVLGSRFKIQGSKGNFEPGTLSLELALAHHRCYFCCEVVGLLLDAFAHFESRKSANRNVLFDRTDLFGYQFTDSFRRILHERLIDENVFFVKFVETPFDYFSQNVIGLRGILWIIL